MTSIIKFLELNLSEHNGVSIFGLLILISSVSDRLQYSYFLPERQTKFIVNLKFVPISLGNVPDVFSGTATKSQSLFNSNVVKSRYLSHLLLYCLSNLVGISKVESSRDWWQFEKRRRPSPVLCYWLFN